MKTIYETSDGTQFVNLHEAECYEEACEYIDDIIGVKELIAIVNNETTYVFQKAAPFKSDYIKLRTDTEAGAFITYCHVNNHEYTGIKGAGYYQYDLTYHKWINIDQQINRLELAKTALNQRDYHDIKLS